MRGFFRSVFPTVVTMLFMSVYTTVDGLFVGRTVGTDAMAAINISYPIMNVMFTLSFGLASGGSIWIANALGEGDRERAGARLTAVLCLGLAAGAAMLLLLAPLLEPVMRLLGATDRLMRHCLLYGGIILLGCPIGIVKEILTYALRVADMPAISMAAAVAGGVSNIVLDYLFIVRCGWGVGGAAAATVAGMAVTLAADLWFLLAKSSLRPAKWSGRMAAEFAPIVRLGLSGGIMELSYAVTIWFFNQMSLGFFREDGVAAYTVIGYVQYALAAVFIGLGNGITPLISFYRGAGEREETVRLLKKSAAAAAAAGVGLCGLGYCGAALLTEIFLPRGTLPFALACEGIRVIAFSCLFMGGNVLIAGTLNAYGQEKAASALTLLRTVVFLMAGAALLARRVGFAGMMAGYVLAELLTLAVSIPSVRKIRRLLRQTAA